VVGVPVVVTGAVGRLVVGVTTDEVLGAEVFVGAVVLGTGVLLSGTVSASVADVPAAPDDAEASADAGPDGADPSSCIRLCNFDSSLANPPPW
jgi:hypothetical protein